MDQSETAIVQGLQRALHSLLRGESPQKISVPKSGRIDELQELCETTILLMEAFAQAHDFLTCLSKGTLDVDPPPRNFLVSPFKQLHSNLRHLTWQTKQVASGDLSQRVDFLGEFSDAFNAMIDSLRGKRLAELALKRSEERLSLAIDGADLALWDYNIGSGEVVFNKRWAEILEHDPEEIEPRVHSWHERIHPEDKDDFMGAWEDHLKYCTTIFKVEHRLRAKSGDWKWILCIGRIVDRDAQEKPSRVAGICVDINDRKKMEDSLRRNEERFRSLIDQAADAIFVHDFDGRFLEVNRQVCTSLGYTRDELLSMSVSDVDPDALSRGDRAKFWPKLPATFEARHRRQDGAIFPVEIRLGAIEYEDTKVLLAMARDLTDRKRAEESLKEASAFLNTLLNAIPAPVFYKDTNGRYIGFNKSYEEFYGRTQQDLVGKSVFDIAPRELAEVYHAKDLELFLNPGIQVYDSQVKDAQGAIHDVVFHKSTFSDPRGQVLGLIGMILDITERKRAEDERENLRKQLFQAQKLEAVGTLAGGIAHDFNNLLTIINGYTELILSEKTEDDPSHSDLHKILETGRKGADLVQRLLALSKKGESSPQPLDLNRVVENSSKLMERTFPKMIEIEIVLEKDLGMVNADVSQIEQVVMNLCINATEAMPEGGNLRIETRNMTIDEDYCRLHPEGKPGRHVMIEVEDTGKGMDKETMDRMLDPFFTTKGWDFKKGTGLGLSVAKGIVEQHGGWITCQSEPGKGATFKVYFPIIKDSPAVRKPEPLSETVLGGEKILLVDDEELVRDLGKRILERSGYTVITAANGSEALDIYTREQSNIGLVVVDLIMPQMGGEKCLEELIKINPTLRVVVSSGHSLDPKELKRLSIYAKGFVNKPYQMKEFMEVVRGVLSQK